MWASVHPRVCGEQDGTEVRCSQNTGSSPRVRGTARARNGYGICCRFIPACAGNRRDRSPEAHVAPVHPRVCGEQSGDTRLNGVKVGSSPRVRGTGSCRSAPAKASRFIPACAGNRPSSRYRVLDLTVHPRVCGEQVTGNPQFFAVNGSSPRVRGTEPDTYQKNHGLRFIPACAGNRDAASVQNEEPSVHPRVCGEQG